MINPSPTGRTYLAHCELSALRLWQDMEYAVPRYDKIIVTDFSSLEQRVLADVLTGFINCEYMFGDFLPDYVRKPKLNRLFEACYGYRKPVIETDACPF